MRNELQKQRVSKKITQKQIAKAIGITERAYQHIEAGTRNGKTELWLKLSDLLGVEIRQIYKND
jgi:DNA-binding XRE family transcriptional regulator